MSGYDNLHVGVFPFGRYCFTVATTVMQDEVLLPLMGSLDLILHLSRTMENGIVQHRYIDLYSDLYCAIVSLPGNSPRRKRQQLSAL